MLNAYCTVAITHFRQMNLNLIVYLTESSWRSILSTNVMSINHTKILSLITSFQFRILKKYRAKQIKLAARLFTFGMDSIHKICCHCQLDIGTQSRKGQ